jgi:O-antigen/teichoic acid export membrane protein
MLVILLYLLFLHRAENAVAIDPKLVDMGVFKEIAPYSLRTFFLGMSSRVLYYTDYIVIGLFLSAAQVTPYEIAYKLCFLSTYAFSVISTSMFPKFSRLYALGELEELRSLYVAIAKGSLLIMAPIGIGLAFLGEPFIALWVGSEHIVEHQVLLVLILMNVFHAIGTPACMVLQSCGRNKELMYSELLNAMLNVMLSVFLVQRLGVLGVAVGTVVAHVCSSFWVVLVAPCRVTGIGVGEYVRHVIVPPLGVGVGTAAILAALWPEFRVVKSSLDVLLGGVGIVALYGVLYLGCGVSSAERVMCLSLLRRAWGRIGVWARG